VKRVFLAPNNVFFHPHLTRLLQIELKAPPRRIFFHNGKSKRPGLDFDVAFWYGLEKTSARLFAIIIII
jgi:hypothetical protein